MSRHKASNARRKKERQEQVKARRKLAKCLGQIPWRPAKMKLFKMPDIFPPDIPMEKRFKIAKDFGRLAAKEFDEKYPTIESWFSEFDAVYLLSFCAYYFMSHVEGTDPEVLGKLDFPHHFLEILQAFALCQPRTHSPNPLADAADTLKEDLRQIGDLMQNRLWDIPDTILKEQDLHKHVLRTEMMENTSAVRNWAYASQMKQVTVDLAGQVKEEFHKRYGIEPARFFDALFVLTEQRTDKLNAHIDRIRKVWRESNHIEMARAYSEAFPDTQPIMDEQLTDLWEDCRGSLDIVRDIFRMHSDLKLGDIFTFTIRDLVDAYGDPGAEEALRNACDSLSFSFGDLSHHKKEYFILDNPVHQKPFIRLGNDEYFSAVWGILYHLSLSMLEGFIAEDGQLRQAYSNRLKPMYLEDSLESLFRASFCHAEVLRGSQWVDPSSAIVYENDLTVVAGPFAIVVEAKSGAVTPPARRGAPDRLFETLQELIEEPSTQAQRFIKFLKEQNRRLILTNRRGEANVIDSSQISYYIPVSVTLEHLGMISCNLKKLREAGITSKPMSELSLSVSLTDLQCIFEILARDVEKIHYLARRREFEDHVDYEGDELDLLAFYLDNGFNIGEGEYERNFVMNLTLKSKEVDPYFIGHQEGKPVAKPHLQMSKWWVDLLDRLQERTPTKWRESSYVLLNSTLEDQRKFQKAVKKLSESIRNHEVEKKHNWVVWLSGPPQRRYFIAGYPYETTDKEERNGIIETVLNDERAAKARGAVLIGLNLNRSAYPYSVMAGLLSTRLFDIGAGGGVT